MPHTRLYARAAIGALTFLVVQLSLLATMGGGSGGGDAPGWFLNSGRNVALIIAAITLVAAVSAAAWPAPVMTSAVAFAGGAAAALTVTLFVIGPGSLFPIAIAIGTVAVGLAASAGTVVGALVARGRR